MPLGLEFSRPATLFRSEGSRMNDKFLDYFIELWVPFLRACVMGEGELHFIRKNLKVQDFGNEIFWFRH